MDDWDSFVDGCEDEEYVSCAVVIDNEAYKNVAIRAKGNTSLSSVAAYGNDRYSFKIEFDHYDSGKNLAVEGVEDSFLERNYGTSYGELYKPDRDSLGGQKMEPPAGTESDGQKMQKPDGDMDNKQGGLGGGMGSDDVSLIYSDDEYSSYSNIFDNTKTDITDEDKDRLIASLKSLNENSDIEEVVNVEEVIRYFVVHNFVCNFDSYTGSMIHNYYLYEEDGQDCYLCGAGSDEIL